MSNSDFVLRQKQILLYILTSLKEEKKCHKARTVTKKSSCEPSSSITEVSRDSIIFPRYCRRFLFFFFFCFSATIYQKSTPTINARCRFFCSFVFYFFFYLKLQINTIFSFEMTKNIHKFFFIINIIITNFA